MRDFSLLVPYYRNPAMLLRQDQEWRGYPEGIHVIVVDDGSPKDPADEVLPEDSRAAIYRIEQDTPWNRNGARNLAVHIAETQWTLHVDIDHVLTTEDAERLLGREVEASRWYLFRRFRRGRADETRRKDAIPNEHSYGEIKPHIDSFLCTRELFWRAGGYDEDFSGSLGGSSLFLRHMRESAGQPVTFEDIRLEVHTRDSVPDASDLHLSRDRSRYARIRAEKRAAGDPKAENHLRFPWRRVR